jgi:uncharacterized protein (DUF1697 family)
MSRYVALLRGINVGGKNLIRMSALKSCFEEQGLQGVATYIASGNVLFTSSEKAPALTARLEAVLAARFGYEASVVLRTGRQMQSIVAGAPAGFGEQPARYRYDVIFLKAPLTALAAMKSVQTNPVVDTADAGTGVLYFSRLIAKAAQSRLGRLISLPVYQSMTIRNWNTTTTLLGLMDASTG